MMKIQVWKGYFISLLVLLVLVDSQQDQSGFVSIDCGIDSSYTDKSTTITYTTDSQYIETGTNMDIAPLYKVSTNVENQQQLKNVRSFPQGTKNCHTLNLPQGNNTSYLIRAYFMYGNYDSLSKPPTFDIYLGVDLWDTVKLDNETQLVTKEIIHSPFTDYLYVCLVNTGSGTPFISGLELRHLLDSIYPRKSGSLDLIYRYYAHATSLDEIRYNEDFYDRIWQPMYLPEGSSITTTLEVNSILNTFKLPSSAMQEAITPRNLTSSPISLIYNGDDPNADYYIFLHVAELQKLSSGQVREFNVTVNGVHLYGPYVPLYLSSDTIYNTIPLSGSDLNVTIHSTNRSTLPPILNALEIYHVKQLSQKSTNQIDADAMVDVKSSYNLTHIWQGDPCAPKNYSWSGLNCSYNTLSSPRITSLNLSSRGLNGGIPDSISNLTALQILDLSNNSLSGQIPDFLADLPELKTLNLDGNSFTGSVPEKLLEKSSKGSISLSVEKNPGLCSTPSCTKNKKKTIVGPIAACAALFVLLSAAAISYLVFTRRKKQKATEIQQETEVKEAGYTGKRKGGLARFTYSDVKNMTRDFQRELGKGGFGVVYYGCLNDGMEVAVKMLSQSIHASEQFSNEVELLMAIRHKNLVSLIGYCEEGDHLALIYEYMAGGNLQTVLSASHALTWKERLQIAIDAAQGLDYLHNGCRPPIVHRDVKTPNILLNKNLQAKIADFGLSKIFPDENRSYISTRVMGTPGYLDPEYHITQQLNEKSDVYSFGVVLLELITGKHAIVKTLERTEERTSLVQWVIPVLETGDIWSIVDEKLQEIHNSNSVWRSMDIAMTCVRPTSAGRPNMSQIVTELKECLAMELDSGSSRAKGPDDSIEMSPVISFSAVGPSAR